MSNPNAAKGAQAERDVRAYLAEVFGRDVRRPHQEGFKDVGDLHLSPFVLQVKNYADIATALNVGLAGAAVQAVNAGEPYGVAIIKKRGANISEARVAMTLKTFRDVVGRMLRAERLLSRHAPDAYDHHTSEL